MQAPPYNGVQLTRALSRPAVDAAMQELDVYHLDESINAGKILLQVLDLHPKTVNFREHSEEHNRLDRCRMLPARSYKPSHLTAC